MAGQQDEARFHWPRYHEEAGQYKIQLWWKRCWCRGPWLSLLEEGCQGVRGHGAVLERGRLQVLCVATHGWSLAGAVRQLRVVMESDGYADMAGIPALGTVWVVPCPQQDGEEQTPGLWCLQPLPAVPHAIP